MDRLERLREKISKEMLGIEIGPWFNPIAPKREGYNVRILDFFSTQELQQRASIDPAISDADAERIEHVDSSGPVDLVAYASTENITGSIDYVVSSHNLEHLPNPIAFLRSVEQVIRPGGLLIMALPDKRTCFDHLRPHSTTAEMLEAYLERRTRPSFSQLFAHNAYHAYNSIEGQLRSGWGLHVPPQAVVLANERLAHAYDIAHAATYDPEAGYVDAHCWTFTPASFHLIILELRELGLVHFDLEELDAPGGHEFLVRLRIREDRETAIPVDPDVRKELLLQVADEVAQASRCVHNLLI